MPEIVILTSRMEARIRNIQLSQKQARTLPVLKTIVSSIRKLLERVILFRLNRHLETKVIIPQEQLDFKKGYSPIHQQVHIKQKIKRNFSGQSDLYSHIHVLAYKSSFQVSREKQNVSFEVNTTSGYAIRFSSMEDCACAKSIVGAFKSKPTEQLTMSRMQTLLRSA